MSGGSSFIIEEWRDLWSFKGDFIIVALAYVFSPANFLRLPELMRRHAGGSFAIAYICSLLFCCLPLVMMELAIGQLSARAPPQALHAACPLFKGVGVALVLYTLIFMSTFVVQTSYLLNFLIQLFLNVTWNPPWLACGQWWNRDHQSTDDGQSSTTEMEDDQEEGEGDVHAFVQQAFSGSSGQCVPLVNYTLDDYSTGRQSSLQEFYQRYLLRTSERIDEPGEFQWILLSGLAVAWFLVFLAIFLGVRWLGKVAYITFFTALLLLLALLVKALSAPGGEAMIRSLFDTDWDKLMSMELWQDAFTQSLYATGLCFGAYITLGSYNKRDNNLVGQSFLIIFLHLVLSLLQLITAGGLLGHFFTVSRMNFNTKHPNRGYFEDDTNLLLNLATAAFYDLPQVWSALLIMLLIILSLNTMYVLTLNVQSALEDALGDKASKCIPRLGIALITCCLGFAIGLGYTLQSGSLGASLVRSFLDLLTPWVLLVFEIMAIAWFYCAHLLARDVSHALGRSLCWLCSYAVLELLYFVAAAPVYILVRKLTDYSFGKVYKYDDEANSAADAQWPEAIGWIVALVPILPIPLFMVYIVTKTCIQGPGITYWEKFKYTLISPLRYEVVKPSPAPRYSSNAPGYVLLPQAPLAEPEPFNEAYHNERAAAIRVSNI